MNKNAKDEKQEKRILPEKRKEADIAKDAKRTAWEGEVKFVA